jgi:uncharacterized protein (DUF2236 family)
MHMESVKQPAIEPASHAQTDTRQLGRRLRAQLAATEDNGYFGPGSAMWALHRELALGFGLGRALLLQLAHPWVAQAIKDHSAFRAQPLDRLLATVIAAELLVFGDRAQADAAARRVRGVHGHITGVLPEDLGSWRAGTRYSAEDPAALLWVLVTLLDTSIQVYEACLGRLPDHTVRAYLKEGARLGEMLGVPADTVPGDRLAMERYIATMIADGTIVVGPAAREVAQALLQTRVVPGLAWWTYSAITHVMTARTMPAALVAQYGAILTVRHRPLYWVGAKLGKAAWPRVPDRVRLDPIAAIAIRRAATRAVEDRG